MSNEPDYILDIGGAGAASTPAARQRETEKRPWLAVNWRCCHVYSRIYRNREGTMYIGRCPRCGRTVKARVGPNGMSGRFFDAY